MYSVKRSTAVNLRDREKVQSSNFCISEIYYNSGNGAMKAAAAPKKKVPRRELELEISLLKERNAELTDRLKGL